MYTTHVPDKAGAQRSGSQTSLTGAMGWNDSHRPSASGMTNTKDIPASQPQGCSMETRGGKTDGVISAKSRPDCNQTTAHPTTNTNGGSSPSAFSRQEPATSDSCSCGDVTPTPLPEVRPRTVLSVTPWLVTYDVCT
ncbi:uncharacterized protein LOC112555360 [Pomacea canaliculata]|uniref:uncharacterized protein LOC112555360 n=1 Tax=Pomacea canaliculata TaxID=400727 RepID=UPI000D73EF02|nr:uncharacterized protein LOC112555360 [Pomacea canaliculata]